MRLIAPNRFLAMALIVAVSGAGVPSTRLLADGPPARALFLNTTTSTNSASLRIDHDGGMHVASAAYHTGFATDDPRKPAYYAYCAPQSDCGQATNWTEVPLGDSAKAVQLELTPEGSPRVLVQTANRTPGTPEYAAYWYGECNAQCTEVGNWTLIDLVDTGMIDISATEETKHWFALDPQGRPRFLFGEGALVYASCDVGCTELATNPDTGETHPANWSGTAIERGLYGTMRALAFTSDGQPRIGALMRDPDTQRVTVDYLECNTQCDDAAQWSRLILMDRGQAPESVSLRVDGENRVGIALGQNTGVWYWRCAEHCNDFANWVGGNWESLAGFAEDPDLAFDHQNMPHLAFRSTGGDLGWGLWHLWCVAECWSAQQSWVGEMVEGADALGQTQALRREDDCIPIGWMGDFRPSLALDAADKASFAFDNQFWVKCPELTEPRTQFAAVRVLLGR